MKNGDLFASLCFRKQYRSQRLQIQLPAPNRRQNNTSSSHISISIFPRISNHKFVRGIFVSPSPLRDSFPVRAVCVPMDAWACAAHVRVVHGLDGMWQLTSASCVSQRFPRPFTCVGGLRNLGKLTHADKGNGGAVIGRHACFA